MKTLKWTKSLKGKALLSCGVITLALMGCSGSSDKASSNNNNSGLGGTSGNSTSQGVSDYVGAAMVGDLAAFNFDNGQLALNLEGKYFSTQAGSTQKTFSPRALTGSPGFYFSLMSNYKPSLMLFTEGMAGALIPEGGLSAGSPATMMMALKSVTTDSQQIQDKMFTYNRVEVDPITHVPQSADAKIIEFRSGYTVVLSDLATNQQHTGCWQKPDDQPYFNVEIKDDIVEPCTSYQGFGQEGSIATEPTTDPYYYRFVFKSGNANGRMGLIADKVDGTGFGFGLEKRAYQPPLGTDIKYQVIHLKPSEMGNATLSQPPMAQVELVYTGETGYNVPKGTVTLTPYSCNVLAQCQLDASRAKHYDIFFNVICEPRQGNESYLADSDKLFTSQNYLDDWASGNNSFVMPENVQPVYDGLACMVNQQDDNDNFGVFIDSENNLFMGVNGAGTLSSNPSEAAFIFGSAVAE